MRVVITGGDGFIGRHVSTRLNARGDEVVVFDPGASSRRKTNAVGEAAPPVRLICEDPRHVPGLWARWVDEADAVIHLAALTGTGQSLYEISSYLDTNTTLSGWLVEQAVNRSAVPGRFVLASSRAVYGEGVGWCDEHGRTPLSQRTMERLSQSDYEPRCSVCDRRSAPLPLQEDDPVRPLTPYGLSKGFSESVFALATRVTGVPAIALRLFNVYGPGQPPDNAYTGVISIFAHALRRGAGIRVYEDGNITRDFCYVDDAVGAIVAAVDCPNPSSGVANIGSGRSVTLLEVAVALAKLAGGRRAAPRVRVTGEVRYGDPRSTAADITTAWSWLGWRPSTDLEKGLELTSEWISRGRWEDMAPLEEAAAALQAVGLYRPGIHS